jgi:hypothetical protein
MATAANLAIKLGIASDFKVDLEFSINEADPRMERSFGVCWDTIHRKGWEKSDEDAVHSHGAVLYVLSPPMTVATSLNVSADALALVAHMFERGVAVAVKGESAGIAHGVWRWQDLAERAAIARKNADLIELRRQCRLAFAKRPLEDTGLKTVGFHLVGLPEVWVPYTSKAANVYSVVEFIDKFADEMAMSGVDAAMKTHGAKESFISCYEEDDFKFNPYGTVLLPVNED